jgi:hypothetical protein
LAKSGEDQVLQKQRNVMNAIPHRERKEVSTELSGIFKQEKKEDAVQHGV